MELDEATMADILEELRKRPLVFGLVWAETAPFDESRGGIEHTGERTQAIRIFAFAVKVLTEKE